MTAYGLEFSKTDLITTSNDKSLLVAVAANNLNYSVHSSDKIFLMVSQLNQLILTGLIQTCIEVLKTFFTLHVLICHFEYLPYDFLYGVNDISVEK